MAVGLAAVVAVEMVQLLLQVAAQDTEREYHVK
jgi:hypothetical protein